MSTYYNYSSLEGTLHQRKPINRHGPIFKLGLKDRREKNNNNNNNCNYQRF